MKLERWVEMYVIHWDAFNSKDCSHHMIIADWDNSGDEYKSSAHWKIPSFYDGYGNA